jgi:AAA15 family ATPase/GTPase
MIEPVHIQNFKSIRDLKFNAKRINLFIGEPNTGKSNIIEALAFFAQGALNHFGEIFRFKTIADLFFDQKVTKELNVKAGDWEFSLKFTGAHFQGVFLQSVNPQTVIPRTQIQMDYSRLVGWSEPKTPLRYYRFKPLDLFPNGQPGTLNPPFGDNLVAVLYSNEELRQKIGSLIRSKGFRLQLKPTDNELLIAKDVNDELYSYPWKSVSETLRRVIFLMVVLETNQKATLLLDEPESNTFPFYTKYLAERIALDESNQFFLTTHNPYLLSSIVEKAPPKDLAVFVTRMEKFETKLAQIPDTRLPELLELDSDAFFNLDKLVAA